MRYEKQAGGQVNKMVFDGAKWIGAAACKDAETHGGAESSEAPALYFRRDFTVGRGLVRAVLYVTARGLYEAYVNDCFAGDELFASGDADADGSLTYMEYDVTEKLRKGKNTVGAVVAERECENGVRREARLLMRLTLEYSGGRPCEIVSDSGFKTAAGRILSCGAERGETVDNRLPENYDMFSPDIEAAEWRAAAEYGDDFSLLRPQEDEPVRFLHRLKGIPVKNTERLIYDFGQDAAGAPYLIVKADEGARLTLRYAEALRDGALCFASERERESRDIFYCRRGRQILTTSFTYHACRYAELTVENGEAKVLDLYFNVCHSDLTRTGMFDSSNALLNRLFTNALWSQRSCFISAPMRSSSAGKRSPDALYARVFCGSAMYNADCRRFYARYLRRLREEGATDCAVCEIPYRHYLVYGDSTVLRDNADAMKTWVNAQKAQSDGLIMPADGESDRGELGTVTDGSVAATALFAHGALLTAESLDALGLESAEYYTLFEDIKAAFNRKLADGFGRLKSDTPSCYLMALAFGLCTDEAECFRHLLRTLERDGFHTTGVIGASLLLPMLCKYGREDLAYGLLLSTDRLSFGGQVSRGAVSVWENRDGNVCVGGEGDGALSCCGFASFAEWMYSHVLGIRPDAEAPGFKSVIIKPVTDPLHRVKEASGCYESDSGRLDVEWTDEDGLVTLRICKEPSMKARLDIRGDVLSVEADGEAAALSLVAGAEEICVRYKPKHGGIEI